MEELHQTPKTDEVAKNLSSESTEPAKTTPLHDPEHKDPLDPATIEPSPRVPATVTAPQNVKQSSQPSISALREVKATSGLQKPAPEHEQQQDLKRGADEHQSIADAELEMKPEIPCVFADTTKLSFGQAAWLAEGYAHIESVTEKKTERVVKEGDVYVLRLPNETYPLELVVQTIRTMVTEQTRHHITVWFVTKTIGRVFAFRLTRSPLLSRAPERNTSLQCRVFECYDERLDECFESDDVVYLRWVNAVQKRFPSPFTFMMSLDPETPTLRVPQHAAWVLRVVAQKMSTKVGLGQLCVGPGRF